MSPDPIESLGGVASGGGPGSLAPLAGPRGVRPAEAAAGAQAAAGAGGLQPFVQGLLLLVMGLLTGRESRWRRRWVPVARSDREDSEDSPSDGGSAPSRRKIDMGLGRPPAMMRQGRRVGAALVPGFDAMVEAARADGVSLRLISGYRSYTEQVNLHHRAAPGEPERFEAGPHEEGWALDFANTSGAYAWLRRNASRFGFAGGHPEEPWHFHVDGP